MNIALTKAIDVLGSAAALSRLCGPTPQAINGWKRRGRPPAPYCVAIEAATGVRCEELRPDLVWTRNEAGQVTGYHVPVSMRPSH
jgi:DNA-binding transcriptional regulator YdaS (Cro superfamily)